MYLALFKAIAATSIFLLTLTAGLLPLKIAKEKAHLLHLGDAFASGVFLSAALLHLLPEADKGFRLILSNDSYPLAQLICIASFVLLLLMERSIFTYGKRHFPDSKIIAPFLLILLLAIHSLVEGAAIGTSINLAETSMLFFAVIAHKGSESFALAINLHHYSVSTKNIKQIIALFSFITPLGIFVASLVMYALQTNSGNTLGSVFNAIAAGTFLYLGTEHLVEGAKSFESFLEIAALILGITLMALVAIWV
ncbi:MAG: zinc/iron ABC transporter permease [uncultured bacterium]|nr:MAG: zinc/iron ABC transporter permease [uncultured bacterium]